MSPQLRSAHVKDLELLLPMVLAFHRQERISQPEAAVRDAIRPLLGHSSLGRLWLIQHDAQTVGYVALCFGYSIEFGGRDAFIDELYLEAQHRSKGLGTRVLESVAVEARALGIKALHLEVDSANEPATRLYARAGFVRRSRSLMSRRLDEAHGGAAPG